VATYPETVKVRDQLFPASDKALYIAKHEGRNRVRAKPSTRGRTAS
jgi:PleD family two-component response regulator